MSTTLPSTATGGHHAISAAALMATYMQAVNISIPNAALPQGKVVRRCCSSNEK